MDSSKNFENLPGNNPNTWPLGLNELIKNV